MDCGPPDLCHNGKMKPLSLANQFLIAMPNMADPIFARALVYVCEHGEHGAMGLVINKPSGIALAQLFDQIDLPLQDNAIATMPVLFGGPVQPDRGFVLHSPGGDWQSSLSITDDLMLTTSKDVLAAVSEGSGPEHLLVTLGYAGWSSGQLEDEIASNAWLTAPCELDILFGVAPEARFEAAMALLGFDPSLLSGDVGHA